jgi:conjugative transfer region lipoprotein (TIGR03751 family)
MQPWPQEATVNWINVKTIGFFGVTAALTLTGCATQDTILPPAEREMADIYRQAMDQVEAPVVETFNPQVICAGLELEESPQDCQEKLEEHAAAAYRHIDSNPVQQPLDYIQYTRTTQSELDTLFPRLENPDLVIYVYPHLATRTRAPIPGYTTVVPLFERVEYRLPGESLLSTAPANVEAASAAGDAP